MVQSEHDTIKGNLRERRSNIEIDIHLVTCKSFYMDQKN